MKKADINKPAFTMYPKSVKFLGDYPHKVLKQSKNKKLSKDKLPVIKKGRVQRLCNLYFDLRRTRHLST